MFAVSPPSFSVRPVPAHLAADVEDDNVGLPSGGDGSGDVGGPGRQDPGAGDRADLGLGQEPPDRLGQGHRPVGVLGGLLHVRVRLRQLGVHQGETFGRDGGGIETRHREPADAPGDPQHAERRRVGVVGEADHGAGGMRADHRHLLEVAAEWQQIPLVLEQGHRLVREPAGQLVALARRGGDLHRIFGDVRVVEQAEGELVPQHAAHRLVQLGLGSSVALHGLDEHLPVALDARRLDVHAGGESERRDLLGVGCDQVARLRPADGAVIGDDRPASSSGPNSPRATMRPT
jgi:hypothetical protein